MSARNTGDNFQKDYRPLVFLVWALLISFFHLTGFFPYTFKGDLQPSVEDHFFAWIQGDTVFDDGLYRFSSAVEVEKFFRQNDVYSLSLINRSDSAARTLSSARHEIKEKTELSPKIAPFFFLPVSVNAASAEILETLPGIGKKLAERIIDHRKNLGLFQELDDLLVVKGIGEKKLSRLRPLISL